MKLLQINTSVNSGSTGRIAEDIGKVSMAHGHESYIAYGRGRRPSQSNLLKIGSQWDVINHGFKTAIFDRHAFGSRKATKELIKEIDKISPDLIGLHNLHGYYLNIDILFEYLKEKEIPVVWTLFDCWAFTGHCSYFDNINCKKWIDGCYACPKTRKYPASYLLDQSRKNFGDKKSIFNRLDNLHIIVHSIWLKKLVEQSFLKSFSVHHIFSGIDLEVFKPSDEASIKSKHHIENKKIILGVANIWDIRKGLSVFKSLFNVFGEGYAIILVGLTRKQINELPTGMIGIERTESVSELAAYYSAADVFVNPTLLDNFPTTNIEALACGTPVVTYNTGGSPEAVDQRSGSVVEQGDIQGLVTAITDIMNIDRDQLRGICRKRAELLFNKEDRYLDYLKIFKELT